jgi:hypothetical protein
MPYCYSFFCEAASCNTIPKRENIIVQLFEASFFHSFSRSTAFSLDGYCIGIKIARNDSLNLVPKSFELIDPTPCATAACATFALWFLRSKVELRAAKIIPEAIIPTKKATIKESFKLLPFLALLGPLDASPYARPSVAATSTFVKNSF